MAPTPAKPASAAAKKPKSDKKTTVTVHSRSRNHDLGNGVVRFSRTRMYHKKALWKFMGKKVEAPKKEVKRLTIEKPIGGDKNGKTRIVSIKKKRSFYPTQDKVKKHPAKKLFKQHKRTIRSTLTPGTVCIVLAGPHKGKRVVLLKQLFSGLLLITGPFKVNACPMRRISQRYVIGTTTKLDISGVKLPETINDDYFRRERKKRAKKEEGEIFAAKKETYKPSEQRKADQKLVDKEINTVIRNHPERKLLFGYLGTMWGLRSSQFPHRMKF